MEKQRLAWILGLLGLLSSWTTAQTGLMPTAVESLDGNQRDLAISLSDVTTVVPLFERVYAAQGRRMAMHVVSTRDRQFFGEPTGFATDLSAVEIDEARNLMFVLTGATNTGEPDLVTGEPIIIKGKLRVYNIDIPSAPQEVDVLDDISAADIRIIPEDQKLLLIHKVPNPSSPPPDLWRVTVFDYQGASALTEMPNQHVDLPVSPYLLAETCPEDPLERQVISLGSAAVQVDNSVSPAIRRVFLRAGIKHTRVSSELQKGATGIVAIKLDPVYTLAPTFYPFVFDAYPCPVPTDPLTGEDV